MRYQAILVEKRDAVCYLILNRPQRGNLLDMAMAEEIAEACQQITDDDEARLVLLAGAGGIFCCGEDLEEYRRGWGGAMEQRRWPPARQATVALAGLRLPIIAAIEGDAIGAGLELALCCDLRVASQEARFSLPQVAMGLIPAGGGTQRLPRLVGRGKALEMLLIAETLDAAQALSLGLVNRLTPRGDALAGAEEMARRILERAPIAVTYAKESVAKGMDAPLDQGLRLEADLSIILQTTADRDEGIRAFLEKRSPRFKGG
ncbi:MAG: enoyl-CoA hydratase/isomerase family protein [Chloroflexi bacterium]|nr:enoyl-CoA hydratase/isomerase family protein [Chloroflexota bacterium]